MKINPNLLLLSKRQQAILDLLADEIVARVRDLASAFNVDAMTIRRDLNDLQQLGLVARMHGECRLSERGAFDLAFKESRRQHRAAKKSIGEFAAQLVKPGQVVLIDSGTTPLAVANALMDRGADKITIVTSALTILWELYDAPQLKVIALGGDLRRETGQLYGPITETVLSQLVIDIAFLGADGINLERGFGTTTAEAARLAGTMAASACDWYVVADASKIGQSAPFVYAPLAKAKLITDRLTPQQKILFKKKGLKYIEADKLRRKA